MCNVSFNFVLNYKMMNRYLLFCTFFFGFASSNYAQTGKLEGRITDLRTGSKLTSVTVEVVETQKKIASDIDGHYILNLDTGKIFTIRFSSIGYATKIIEEIKTQSGKTTVMDVSLETATKTEQAVEVRSTLRKESVNAMLNVQKNTAVVAQVISAEAIRRTPDRNTGEVLKRVPGTSVQEGKYLVVRGLSDRYNQAMLNGILLSSTEPDRKTFSFDIFPAPMIENIVMNKTFIPELSGEWAGGLVQVQTRDVPASSFLNVQTGIGFNSNTIGNNFLQSQGGNLDWLGVENGARALPANLPLRYNFSQLNSSDKTAYGTSFKNNWKPAETQAPLNSSFQINGGGNTKILGKKVSGVFALTYNNSNRTTPFSNTFIANNNGDVELSYQNRKYARDILAGGLANVTFTLNSNHKISFKNILNVNSTDFVIDRYDGRDYIISGGGNGDRVRATEISFKQNTFFNTQVIGEHQFTKINTRLKWYGGFNILDQYTPDQRRLFYTQDGNDPNSPYYALLGLGAGQKSGSIFYAFLNDYIYNTGGDVSRTFDWKGNKHTIKAGYLFQVKDRLFDSRPFFINTSSNSIKQLPADQIFAPSNFGMGNNKIQFDEIGGNAFRYMANTIMNAAYLQFDNPIGEKFRMVWGVRFESFDQLVGSVRASDPRHVNTLVNDFLPGVNLTYKLNTKNNLRLAASQTVIRPEFRELSPFAFYDFELGAQVVGNKSAQRTKVTNLDLRYEIYPRAGELFTVGVFYKNFDKPIEYYFNRTGPGTNTFNILNTDRANALGAEIDIRKKLTMVNALKHFTVTGNVSYIYSNVKDTTGIINRPLQGQSPYLINLGLMYDLESKGLIATLLFNQIGRRILFVGNEAVSDIWENPRPLIDLQVSKKILKGKGEIRLNINDLLNRQADFYHDLDNSRSYRKNSSDVLAISRNYGTTYSLSFGYSIK